MGEQMRFVVYGRDDATFDFGPSDRHEAHQAYMDGWLPRLIARGPTLSPDGEQHTGSVHVVEVDSAETAREFAFAEPYARAGWYREISVLPMSPLVDGTMWDRPRPAAGQPSSFVRVSWPDRPVDDVRIAASDWLFAGLLLGEDPGTSVGFAGSVDLAPAEAAQRLRASLPEDAEVEVHRWERGGRRE